MALINKKAKTFAALVKLEHTIFALPFAYLGAVLALKEITAPEMSLQVLPSFKQLFWITVAMVGARSAAMGMNRLIDRDIDRINPRTAARHLPRGLVSVREVKAFVIGACLAFAYSVYRLSPGHVVWVPIILLLMAGYSYAKRYTCLSHLMLGLVIGLAPLGGWIAVTQKLELSAILLGLLVAFWIAGFDIIYATLDYDFDKEYGLYSLPVTLGLTGALTVAAALHFAVAILLFVLYFILNLGWLYLTGVFITVFLLYYEHAIISAEDLSRVDAAFFNVNGLISIQLLAFTLLDIIL